MIIKVTTLADRGTGSLREAINASGERLVVFEVGGLIELNNPLIVSNSGLRIAGQTAPSPGVTIAGKMLRINTSDVAIEHIACRGSDYNGVAISGNADGSQPVRNITLRHVSISHAANKNLLTWYPGVADVTVRNCIISESLPWGGSQGNRMGFLIGDHAQRVTVVGCLFAHNSRRNPAPFGDTSSIIVNNLIYNPGSGAIHFQDSNGSGPLDCSVVGNVILPGPDMPDGWYPFRVYANTARGTIIYLRDNVPGRVDVQTDFDVLVDAPPFEYGDAMPHEHVFDYVLAHAGARPWDRDAIDRRVVSEVRNGAGGFASSFAVPNLPSTYRALNPPEDEALIRSWLSTFEGGNIMSVVSDLELIEIELRQRADEILESADAIAIAIQELRTIDAQVDALADAIEQ